VETKCSPRRLNSKRKQAHPGAHASLQPRRLLQRRAPWIQCGTVEQTRWKLASAGVPAMTNAEAKDQRRQLLGAGGARGIITTNPSPCTKFSHDGLGLEYKLCSQQLSDRNWEIFSMNSLPPLDMHCHPIQTDEYVKKYSITDAYSLFSGEIDRPSLLAVTMSPDEWRGRARTSLEGSAKSVWALGLHPWERQSRDQLVSFLNLVSECDAVGEVGLDGSSWAGSDLNSQRETLIAILDNQHTRDRIVSVHGYETHTYLLAVLEEHLCPGVVYHWFLASGEILRRAIALDIFYSVNHAMFSVPEGPAVVSAMPRTRVLIETDAPAIDRATGRALSPGDDETDDRPLWPGEVSLTEAELGRVWGVEVAQVRRQVWQNLAELESRLLRRPFSAGAMLSHLDACGTSDIQEP